MQGNLISQEHTICYKTMNTFFVILKLTVCNKPYLLKAC